MQPLGNPLYHLQLMERMSQAVGARLSEALAEGSISTESWAGMITRCRRCRAAARCAAFLAAHERAGSPMPGCRNAGALMQMKGRAS